MVIYTNHHRLKRQFGGQHAIWWNGSGILSSEWIKTLVLKGPGIKPICKNEHRTSNVQLAKGEQAFVRLRRIEC